MILVLGATGATGGEVARQPIAAGKRPRPLVPSAETARAVAVRALTTPGHEGQVYALSGPESPGSAGYAAVRTTAIGTRVRAARAAAAGRVRGRAGDRPAGAPSR